MRLRSPLAPPPFVVAHAHNNEALVTKMVLFCISIILVYTQFVRPQDTNCTYIGTLCKIRESETADIQAGRRIPHEPPQAPEPHTALILGGTAAYLTCCVIIFAVSLVYRRYKREKLNKVFSSACSSQGSGPAHSSTDKIVHSSQADSVAKQADETVKLSVKASAHGEDLVKEDSKESRSWTWSISLPDDLELNMGSTMPTSKTSLQNIQAPSSTSHKYSTTESEFESPPSSVSEMESTVPGHPSLEKKSPKSRSPTVTHPTSNSNKKESLESLEPKRAWLNESETSLNLDDFLRAKSAVTIGPASEPEDCET